MNLKLKAYREFIAKENQSDIRNRLKNLKKEREISIEAIHRATKVTSVTLRRFLEDQKDVKPDVLEKIVEYIDESEAEKKFPDLAKQTQIK